MSLERALQVCVAVMAALASVLLGMGEGDPVLPVLAVIVAASSVYFVDARGWIYLNTPMANLAGLAALVASLWDYRRMPGEENQLLALANFLIYLQCVLLYRQKTHHIYWMLALLSLLQVAVATVLNMSVAFGLLMLAFMLLAIATLIVFLIYREQQQYAPKKAEAAERAVGDEWRTSRDRKTEPFSARSMAAVSSRDIRQGIVRQLCRMGAVTLLLTVAVFVLVPRTGGGAWGERLAAAQQIVGFNDIVALGELGEIVESPEEVLQMRFYDLDTLQPYYLSEVPLLRGTVLTLYRNGQWARDKSVELHEIKFPRPQQRGLVRQEIQIARLSTATLFAIEPIMFDEATDTRLHYDKKNDRLYRGQARYSYPLQYSLVTSGLQDGRQLAMTPCIREPNPHDLKFRLLGSVDPVKHKGLAALAQRIVQRLPPNDPVGRATALERHLRDSGEYRYSLSPPLRNSREDPIEDFIVTNRVGHCEYFASALTLMLRSIGIPARMCVGFKGADWNPLTERYHVRQWHAHAWVEIYLRPDQFPNGLIKNTLRQIPQDEWKRGAWMRLDPTADIGDAARMPPASRFPSVRQMFDYAGYLWTRYVLSMDSRRQREGVFTPLKQLTSGAAEVLFNRKLWIQTFQNIWKLLRGEKLDDTGLWFSWRAAVISFVSLTLLLFLYRGAAWLVRRLMRIARPSDTNARALKDAEVEFYRRLEAILAQRELVRSPNQTQREFARRAGDELATDPRTITVAAIPRKIAEMFYRVRFGQEHLLPIQLESVDRGLGELANALTESSAAESETP